MLYACTNVISPCPALSKRNDRRNYKYSRQELLKKYRDVVALILCTRMSLSYINVSISITLLETLVTTKVNLVLEIIYKKIFKQK